MCVSMGCLDNQDATKATEFWYGFLTFTAWKRCLDVTAAFAVAQVFCLVVLLCCHCCCVATVVVLSVAVLSVVVL